MTATIEAVLDTFRDGNCRLGEQHLTNYMKEQGCSEHVRTIAERVLCEFNEKSKESKALLYLDLLYAPRNPEMLPVYGGISKACTAEFRLFALNEDGSLKGVVSEFVVGYRIVVPVSGSVPCRCYPC